MTGLKLIKTERLRDPQVYPLLVLISDGRGNISLFGEEPLVLSRVGQALPHIAFGRNRLLDLELSLARQMMGEKKAAIIAFRPKRSASQPGAGSRPGRRSTAGG